jgi:hypothetical protein
MVNTDKACVVKMTGGASVYPAYASLGNIHSRVRSKYDAEAWVLIGYLPIADWLVDVQDLSAVLSARLYHQCMSILFESLIDQARSPEMWTDPDGRQRLVVPILMSMPLDHPEQRLVACVRGGVSPISLARSKNFGDPQQAPLRRGRDTLAILRTLAELFDTDDILDYALECGKFDLLGVPDPFWADWWGADPCKFLTTDSLHIFSVFFRDNVLPWIKKMSKSRTELDFRHRVQPRRVGSRHFSNGITKLNKVMGTEQRELQRIIIIASRGLRGISKQASAALRAINDVIFICRYPSHDDDTISLLQEALTRFHSHKEGLVKSGARSDEWRIPKLEKMQHIPRHIRQMGAVQQYSTEVTEYAHQGACSKPYRASNHKEFVGQMARHRDRYEKVRLAPDYVMWKTRAQSNLENKCDDSDGEDGDSEVGEGEAEEVLQNMAYRLQTHDFFTAGHDPELRRYIFGDVAMRLVPRTPCPRYLPVANAISNHGAESFIEAFYQFETGTRRAPPPGYELPFHHMTVWPGLRLQRRSVHDPATLVPSVTVKAAPASAQHPLGRFDPVLTCAKDTDTVGLEGSISALCSIT